ncbi:MAG: bifunctional isocitrate dehydrogenase kinase/phosphatase [Ectothiorhodospiraceae bacterium AqS1]|nr:bifunctional isocitrate dehydrogenase kinase/phosphatase [Ectothiorhodospiraceae bacterium AqS1]
MSFFDSIRENASRLGDASSAAGKGGVFEMPAGASTLEERADHVAAWILAGFDAYYTEARGIPARAKAAFEDRDPARSLALSRRRLAIYNIDARSVTRALCQALPQAIEDEGFWSRVEAVYLPRIQGRYESDMAFAWINSVRRMICEGMWAPVDYAFLDHLDPESDRGAAVRIDIPLGEETDIASVVERILCIPDFKGRWRDFAGDVQGVSERLEGIVRGEVEGQGPKSPAAACPRALGIQMASAGFFRNRGAYLVGRIVFDEAASMPLILALLNHEAGIYVEAVIHGRAHAHNLFSSTLANFHVTSHLYHEMAAFLYAVMPTRRLGLHYSTIGFNHVGKVAVMSELREEVIKRGERFTTAIGFRGSVAIGFAAASSDYNLKVIRDTPTDQYKWGEFPGIDAVLDKYRQVHEIDRTGSMLDNIIYHNLELDSSWFEPALLEELLRDASKSVSRHGDAVILRHLIVQRRVRPLPVFLEEASYEEAAQAIVNLGHCIKNNAAANVFNKDLDARNYGVSRYHKVYLFDYDALEPLTSVKIRSNSDREDGEDIVPDWFYEEGTVFLPEEIEAGFRLLDRDLRRLFRSRHGDLMSCAYWEGMQRDLERGDVPGVRLYPEHCRIEHPNWPSSPMGE